jgi:hypothetical protein
MRDADPVQVARSVLYEFTWRSRSDCEIRMRGAAHIAKMQRRIAGLPKRTQQEALETLARGIHVDVRSLRLDAEVARRFDGAEVSTLVAAAKDGGRPLTWDYLCKIASYPPSVGTFDLALHAVTSGLSMSAAVKLLAQRKREWLLAVAQGQ